MSKVEELRLKYPKVTKPTFNKFVDADFTPTKKYLEFMLKTWTNKEKLMVYTTTKIIIDIVKKFDSLLPYIENKDIYHKDYADLALLYYVIDTAEAAKDEKTFVREEHANVLIENDKYLLLQPTTHRGSLKYGAGSKWCTASKRDPEVFTRYTKNGYLAYLIDKTKKVSGSGSKMALYMDYSECSINGKIDFFNTIDSNITVSSVKSYEWDESDLFDIVTTFRYYHIKMKTIKKDRDFVDGFIGSLTKLNFEEFEKSLNNLEDKGANVYTLKIKEKVEEFLTKLNKTQYAIRETKN
jgi:hypothetical protein